MRLKETRWASRRPWQTARSPPCRSLREALSIYLQVLVVGARNEDIDVAHALTALEPVAKMKAEARARAAAAASGQAAEPVLPEPVSPEPMPTV